MLLARLSDPAFAAAEAAVPTDLMTVVMTVIQRSRDGRDHPGSVSSRSSLLRLCAISFFSKPSCSQVVTLLGIPGFARHIDQAGYGIALEQRLPAFAFFSLQAVLVVRE